MTSLILHIGRHRTGSTSIQQSLYRSRDYLKSKGILYPATGLHHEAHHSIGWSVLGTSHHGLGDIPPLEPLLHQLSEEVRSTKCEHVIISTETLVQLNDPANPATRKRLQQLLALFSTVKVVCCVRDQAKTIESEYRFQVAWKATRLKESFSDFARKRMSSPGLSNSDYEDYYLSLKPNIVFQFWSFSEAVASGNPVRRFFHVAGLEQGYRMEAWINESLSREAALAILEFNRSAIDERFKASYVAWAKATFPETGSSLYNAELLADVLKRYKEADTLLEFRTGIRFLDTPDPAMFASRCQGETLQPHELDLVAEALRVITNPKTEDPDQRVLKGE